MSDIDTFAEPWPRLRALAKRVDSETMTFARNEVAQMGAYLRPRSASPWAQDPEALALFALDVARDDSVFSARVFDWLLVNQGIVSARRLRTLSGEDPLADAVVSWLAMQRTRIQRPARDQVEQAFVAAGLNRRLPSIDGMSKAPPFEDPINLAFRLREFLGVGARAEVVRLLLTSGVRAVTAPEIAKPAGYTARNVYEALSALARGGVISRWFVQGNQRFGLDRDRWSAMLGLKTIPQHRDWPALLGALRHARRTLPVLETTHSPAIGAHELLTDLHAARIFVTSTHDPFETIELGVERALALLKPEDH